MPPAPGRRALQCVRPASQVGLPSPAGARSRRRRPRAASGAPAVGTAALQVRAHLLAGNDVEDAASGDEKLREGAEGGWRQQQGKKLEDRRTHASTHPQTRPRRRDILTHTMMTLGVFG